MEEKKWVMIVKNKEDDIKDAWREDLQENGKPLPRQKRLIEVKKFAQSIINNFNADLREGESPREYLGVSRVDSKLLEGRLKND